MQEKRNRFANANQDDGLTGIVAKYSITLLRLSLAVTYIWFGILKVVGRSPVADLVAETAPPFLPKRAAVPVIGATEVAIGLGLLDRQLLPVTLLLLFGHIGSTFLVFVRLPRRAFQNGKPPFLTKDGEFVLKNLVLLSAGLVVAATLRRPTERLPERAQEG
jgi:putative oxidoreductase